MSEPSVETVRRAQRGDRDALVEIVTGQQRYVYSIAMSLMRNPDDAADLTQEAFARLLRSIGTYRAETRFTTWLYRLVVNLGLDQLRRRELSSESLDARLDLEVPDHDPVMDAPLAAERAEVTSSVRRAVDSLPPAQRLALTLHYLEDMRYEDVAEVMAIPVNTVKSHIRRGKERLGRLLGAELRNDPVRIER